jgi:hypothetical protein
MYELYANFIYLIGVRCSCSLPHCCHIEGEITHNQCHIHDLSLNLCWKVEFEIGLPIVIIVIF